MTQPVHTPDQALNFYRAALLTARLLDQESETRMLDADADAAWEAQAGEFPPVVRCDLVLRNLAMLYPAAFAPGPVFGLSGWYDDAPWGTGFERPDRHLVETLFAQRSVPASSIDALDAALNAWNLASVDAPALTARISSKTTVIVTGGRAAASVIRLLLGLESPALRTQVLLASVDPGARHTLGLACALLRQAHSPFFVDVRRDEKESLDTWADREKRRLDVARADLVVLSPDASPAERQAALALARCMSALETVELTS